MTDNNVLTIRDAGSLAELVKAVEGNKKLEWYPFGADSADNPAKFEIRAFTHEGGGFWPHDRDIRDAYVWCSGMFERWLNVRDVMTALQNIDGSHGLDQPIAIIRERY